MLRTLARVVTWSCNDSMLRSACWNHRLECGHTLFDYMYGCLTSPLSTTVLDPSRIARPSTTTKLLDFFTQTHHDLIENTAPTVLGLRLWVHTLTVLFHERTWIVVQCSLRIPRTGRPFHRRQVHQFLVQRLHCHIDNSNWEHSILSPVVYQNGTCVLPWPIDVPEPITEDCWRGGTHPSRVSQRDIRHHGDSFANCRKCLPDHSTASHKRNLRVEFLDCGQWHALDPTYEHQVKGLLLLLFWKWRDNANGVRI